MSDNGNIKRALEELRTAREAIQDAEASMEAADSEALSAAGARLNPYFDMYRRRVENVTAFKLRMLLCADIEERNAEVQELRETGYEDGALSLESEIDGLRQALKRVKEL